MSNQPAYHGFPVVGSAAGALGGQFIQQTPYVIGGQPNWATQTITLGGLETRTALEMFEELTTLISTLEEKLKLGKDEHKEKWLHTLAGRIQEDEINSLLQRLNKAIK